MVNTLPQRGVLRVVPGAQLEAQLQAEAAAKIQLENPPQPDMSALAAYVRGQFEMSQRHRDDAASGWTERMLSALRTFNGVYDSTKIAEIRKFGGSMVYARIVAMKCRGANSLLRDVYLAPDRPWAIEAPADPDLPAEVIQSIQTLVQTDLMSYQQLAQQQSLSQPGAPPPEPPNPAMIRDRVNQLMEAARNAEKKNARKRAALAQDKIEEILESGGFYKAMAEVLMDLPLFPFACLKGPVVRIVPDVTWEPDAQGNVAPTVSEKPRMFWER